MNDDSAGSIADEMEFLLQRPAGVDPLVPGFMIPVDDLVWVRWDAALREPFDPSVVDFRMQSGVAVPYIDARLVAQRLTETVGRGRWQFDFDPLVTGQPKPQFDQQQNQKPRPDSLLVVKGTLMIAGIRFADVGIGWDIEPSKAAISDSLKRCAVGAGIFAYAYDLVTSFLPDHKVEFSRINPLDIARFRGMLPKPGDPLLRTTDPHPVVDLGRVVDHRQQQQTRPTIVPTSRRPGDQQQQPEPGDPNVRRMPNPAEPSTPLRVNTRRSTPLPAEPAVDPEPDDLFPEPATGQAPTVEQLRQQFAKLRVDAGYSVDQGRALIAESFKTDPRFRGQRLTPDAIYAKLNADDLARVCDSLRPIAERNRGQKRIFAGGQNRT